MSKRVHVHSPGKVQQTRWLAHSILQWPEVGMYTDDVTCSQAKRTLSAKSSYSPVSSWT